ncbi:nitroreductase family protein [Candidatus Woesearchaeota archaeon]|nr:nitroreductase family protein [Candidatus Woesearchaeota archaeon]
MKRKTEYKVDDIFPNRWSARAMSGEEIDDNELMTLFEAARWAPSSLNNQHWRFIYAKRNTVHWDKFFSLLKEGNKVWAKNASVLIITLSKKTYDRNNKSVRTHSFDAGAAWENLALQGIEKGLVVHPIGGFDFEKAAEMFPKEYNVKIMVAVGKQGNKDDLPEELQEREVPSDRKKLNEMVFEGEFKG